MQSWLWSLPARVPVKLFFAVRPDDEASMAIQSLGARLKSAHRLRGRVIAPQRLHNTLAAVHDSGAISENIARAKAIGDRLRHRGFAVRFDWTGSFQGHDRGHPFVLRGGEGLEPLSEFRATLRIQMQRAGFAVDQSFTPHVTLLWADRCVEDYPVAPICWTVREFVLVASLQGHSRHIDIARWTLG
ncbi:MAG TPA: 2'-5' RNA ligase family protein [Rhizomicrobium sp.]|nr:2'-5' RNA ligase family protein [Rhizomicrobium sp.]